MRIVRAHERRHTQDDTAARLSGWVVRHATVLAGLEGLRELGEQADEAVQTVLDVPEIRRFRLSWELFCALTTGDGDDPERVLLAHLPVALLDGTTRALGLIEPSPE